MHTFPPSTPTHFQAEAMPHIVIIWNCYALMVAFWCRIDKECSHRSSSGKGGGKWKGKVISYHISFPCNSHKHAIRGVKYSYLYVPSTSGLFKIRFFEFLSLFSIQGFLWLWNQMFFFVFFNASTGARQDKGLVAVTGRSQAWTHTNTLRDLASETAEAIY